MGQGDDGSEGDDGPEADDGQKGTMSRGKGRPQADEMVHAPLPPFLEQKLASGELRGELAAVGLFVDLVGFTPLTEKIIRVGDAEAIGAALEAIFDPLVGSTYSHGGFVTTYVGDGFRALFPGSPESAGRNALATALDMQSAIAETSPLSTIAGEIPVEIKIGLAEGRASWHIVQAKGTLSYHFLGSALDGSTDAESEASPGEILIDASLQRRLDSLVEVETRGAFYRVVSAADSLRAARVSTGEASLGTALPSGEPCRRDAPDGEFRNVVSVSATVPSREGEALIEGFAELVLELQAEYGGFVVTVDVGDKGTHSLLLWGAPIAYENDFERALIFALKLRDVSNVPVQIGITSDVVYAGPIGPSYHWAYTAFGSAIPASVRQMTAAPRGEIWVDSVTARRAQRQFVFRRVGMRWLKGLTEAREVHALLGRVDSGPRIAQREIIGRDRELSDLDGRLAPIFEGRWAGITLVRGTAGVGKSRLLQELRRTLGGSVDGRVTWLRFAADQMLTGSLSLFRSRLRELFGVVDGVSEEDNRAAFEHRIGALLLGAHHLAPELEEPLNGARSFLGALVNVHWPDSVYSRLVPEARLNGMLEALHLFFRVRSLSGPLVLEIEDAHWLDDDSFHFLETVSAEAADLPIAVVVTTRPVPDTAIARASWLDHVVELDGLSSDATAQLAQDVFAAPVSRQLVQLLLEQMGGNPFFVEQLSAYLSEQGLVEDGAGGLEPTARDALLPADIRTLLTARLDRLPRDVRGTVQVAAVLGRRVDVRVLRATVPDDTLEEHLASAEKMAIWSKIDPHTYLFQHVLMRDAALQMQSGVRRRAIHGCVAVALEETFPADRQMRASEIAYHFEYGGETPRALDYLSIAAEHALVGGLYHESETHLRRGISLLGDNGKIDAADTHELKLRITLGSVLIAVMGQGSPEVKETYDRALQLCDRVNPTPELASVYFGLAAHYFLRAELSAAKKVASRCLRMGESLGVPIIQMHAHLLLAHASYWMGDLERNLAHTDLILELYDATQPPDLARFAQNPRITCLVCSSQALWAIGRADEARERADEAIRLAEEMDHPYSMAIAVQIRALLYQHLRRPVEARQASERLIDVSTEFNFPLYVQLGTIIGAWAAAQSGAAEGAVELIEDGMNAWQQMGSQVALPFFALLLAESLLASGRPSEGLSVVEEAISGALGKEEKVFHAELFRVQGLLAEELEARGTPAEAGPEPAAAFLHAVEVAREQGARALELRALLDLHRVRPGEDEKLRGLIAPLYSEILEGGDTEDLRVARERLFGDGDRAIGAGG